METEHTNTLPEDTLQKLFTIVDCLQELFPDGNTPFQAVSRLCEEAGELAKAVNHMERMGMKQEKHGKPDSGTLAKEAQDVLRCVLQLVRLYGIESELIGSIDRSMKSLVQQTNRE